MRNKRTGVFIIFSVLFLLLLSFMPISAATADDNAEYEKARYKGTLQVEGKPEIDFIKTDGKVIDWDNPITDDDGDMFGMVARFNLSNINDIITQVSNGEIESVPLKIRPFIQWYKESAIIYGSFELDINLNAGLTNYFDINQTVLDELKANPNSLFGGNISYLEVFDITSLTETDGIIKIQVDVKDGVTGEVVLKLADDFDYLDFKVDNLFVIKSELWEDVNQINRGEFAELVEISAPETTFLIDVPQDLINTAQMLGVTLTNPFVGIKLKMANSFGDLNLGFVVVYDGNGNTGGAAPVDLESPYPNNSVVQVKNRGTLEKDGYHFVGWNTQADGQGTAVLPHTTFKVARNTILYAQWETGAPALYTVTYVSDEHTSGTVPTDSTEYQKDDFATVLASDLEKTGYRFVGWGYGDTIYQPDDALIITGDITLTAVWEKLPVRSVEKPTDNNPTTVPGMNIPKTGVSTQPWLFGIVLVAGIIVLKKAMKQAK